MTRKKPGPAWLDKALKKQMSGYDLEKLCHSKGWNVVWMNEQSPLLQSMSITKMVKRLEKAQDYLITKGWTKHSFAKELINDLRENRCPECRQKMRKNKS